MSETIRPACGYRAASCVGKHRERETRLWGEYRFLEEAAHCPAADVEEVCHALDASAARNNLATHDFLTGLRVVKNQG